MRIQEPPLLTFPSQSVSPPAPLIPSVRPPILHLPRPRVTFLSSVLPRRPPPLTPSYLLPSRLSIRCPRPTLPGSFIITGSFPSLPSCTLSGIPPDPCPVHLSQRFAPFPHAQVRSTDPGHCSFAAPSVLASSLRISPCRNQPPWIPVSIHTYRPPPTLLACPHGLRVSCRVRS